MSEPICYVVGAGEFHPRGLTPCPGDLIIAADGGYTALQLLGVAPHLVVGDFDSLKAPPDHPNVICLPKEKDDTDLLAALRLGVERGYCQFRIYGGTGGRMDHTLANLQCLTWLTAQGKSGRLMGDGWVAAAVTDGTIIFDAAHRGYISVFSMGDRAEGVCLRGLKYVLENAVLTKDFPMGVSNEFLGQESSVTVKTGTLLVLYYD